MSNFILTEDEKLLVRKAIDKYNIASNQGYATNTAFLNEREQIIVADGIGKIKTDNYLFFGGYPEAVRKIALFLPDYLSAEDARSLGIVSCFRAQYYKEYSLTHRDFLGALTGFGVSRASIGDILVDNENHKADFLLLSDVSSYVMSEFLSVGSAKIKLTQIDFSELYIPAQNFKFITDTVPSLRLDCIVSCGFSLSRDKAVSLIHSGNTELNHFVCQKPDKTLKQEDVISVRGLGKIKLHRVGNLSRKGRIFIEVAKYV